MSGCPTEEALARWIEGALGDADTETVRDHLASCDDCRRTVSLSRLAIEAPAPALDDAGRERALDAVFGPGECADEADLARWIEGTLPDEARAKLGQHLADCDDCRRAVSLAQISLDASAKALTDTGRRRASAAVAFVLPRRSRWLWPASAAAAALLAVPLYLLVRQTGPANPWLAPGANGEPPSAAIRPDRGPVAPPRPPATPPPAQVRPGQVGVTWTSFDEGNRDASVAAGRAGRDGILEATTDGGTTAPAGLVWAGFEFDRPLAYEPGLALRIRYRTSEPRPRLLCGTCELEIERAGPAGTWIDQEIPLAGLQKRDSSEMLTPGVPLGGFFLGVPKGGRLEIDWAMVVRPGP